MLSSGKRHASGLEVDFSGMLTSKWEIYWFVYVDA